jgi:hypothetical protein
MKTAARALVAYRGLWDKFAGPGTLESLVRSYRRGVPSLVQLDTSDSPLDAVLDLVCDATVNSRRQPVYLVADQVLPADRLAAFGARLPDVFAVARGTARSVYGLSHWHHGGWEACGFYVPVSALLDPVASISPYFGRRAHAVPTVLVESLNVVATAEERRRFSGVDEDAVWAALEERAGSRAIMARVSDMVELDQLDQRIREAA